MPHPDIALRTPDGLARPLDALRADVDAAAESGAGWVELHHLGPEIPETLVPLLDHTYAVGLEALLHTSEALCDTDTIQGLAEAGVRALNHTLRTPGDGMLARAQGIPRLRLTAQIPLDQHTAPHLLQLVSEALASADAVRLHRHAAPFDDHVGERVDDAQASDLIESAWLAMHGHDVDFRAPGFDLPSRVPESPTDEDCLVDAGLIDLIRQGTPLRRPRGGTLLGIGDLPREAAAPLPARLAPVLELTRTLEDTGGLLAALGWPAHDLPACLGGTGRTGGAQRCATCPGPPACHGTTRRVAQRTTLAPPAPTQGLGEGAHIHVVIPFLADGLLVHGGLPGLVHALRARGCQVTVHSAWHSPAQPEGPDWPSAIPAMPSDTARRSAHAKAHVRPFLKGLDLSGADAVVVPGWTWSGAVLRHPTLPPEARLIVGDFHLMQGIDSWKKRYLPPGRRSLDTPWWPSERVHVHSCFPGYARLYWYAGVPQHQIHWRPYPMWSAQAPVHEDARQHLFAGGAHLRDHDTLLAAAHLLPPEVHPLHLYAPGRPRGAWPTAIQHQGRAPLPQFWEAIASSRFVIVPLHHHRDRAAGISVVAMARAAGRPVVATATPATIDHIRHEVDGLLVPAGDATALRDAIVRLDTDEALLQRMTIATQQASWRADVTDWARVLIDGAPLTRHVAHPRGFAPW